MSEGNGNVGFLQGLEGEKFILITELQRHLLSLPSTLWTIPSASPDPCPAGFSAGQPQGLLDSSPVCSYARENGGHGGAVGPGMGGVSTASQISDELIFLQ